MSNIYILHGPNLNKLGQRDPTFYGTEGMDEYLQKLRDAYPALNIVFFQSNCEGALIDYLQKQEIADSKGVILNPGALAHTSRALADAVGDLNVPVLELHISNIYAREEWRRTSFVAERAVGVISGLGLKGYALAVDFLLQAPQFG